MPAGAQSLNPWLGLVNSALTAAQYKSGIDADSSIAGNVAGQIYVYPNSPIGLSVLVDTGFDFWSPTTGYIQQAGSTSPTLVTLTAPTTNPYWAMIYFDPNANVCGVVYGAQATTPVLRFPDTWSFIPLAVIQLGVGQSTVTASQIRDIRGFWATQQQPLNLNLTVSGNTTVNLSGVKRVEIGITITAAITLALTNVSYNTEIAIIGACSGASTKVLSVTAATPSGVALGVFAGINTVAATGGIGNGVNLVTVGISVFSSAIDVLAMKSRWVPGQQLLVFT